MFQGIERIDALDSYIHGKTTYQYPDDLVKELELVADEILPPLASLKKDFCLVSDHGFTVFACNKFQKYISLSSRRFATKGVTPSLTRDRRCHTMRMLLFTRIQKVRENSYLR